MKIQIRTTKEVEVKYVDVTLPVRFGEEQIPNDFPHRNGDTWSARIEVDTGKIAGWPEGKAGHLFMKVCDSGVYILLDEQGNTIAERRYYVPHSLIPGEYGDYVDLQINEQGVITNWPKNPSFSVEEED